MPRVSPAESTVPIELDGDQLQAREGEPIAAALLAHDEKIFSRSAKYHRPRGAFCLTGACGNCLMRVDGVPNVPTCRTKVKAGMRLEHQNALPDVRLDVLRANDFVFADWFNHHEFLAGWPLTDKVLLHVARFLSGLGTLPERAPGARAPAVIEHHDVVVVGAGAAGLAASKQLAARGVAHLLLEREDRVGGRLISAAETGQPAPWAAPARCGAEVLAVFADDGAPFLAVTIGERLHLLFYQRLLLANGGHPFLPTFPNNDLPGVMSGRAVATLLRRHGVLAGKAIACTGELNEAQALAALVTSAGGTPLAVGEEAIRAHGLREVTHVTTSRSGKVACDVIAVCAPQSPAFELAKTAGARVTWNPSLRFFVVEADAQGRTANPNVLVAGELRGPMSSAAAAEQGLAAADALAAAVTRPAAKEAGGARHE